MTASTQPALNRQTAPRPFFITDRVATGGVADMRMTPHRTYRWIGVAFVLLLAGIAEAEGARAETIVGQWAEVTQIDAPRGAQLLRQLAQGGGPTTTVITNLTRSPQVNRAISTATGPNARALVDTFAKEGGKVFQAKIPTRLIVELERTGFAQRVTHTTPGGLATEIRFFPAASEFIVGFFK